ncbi:spherulation-specific family 4 protein [Rhodotorula paludigena]|uniref:spherulation-specific family 4 protein n=1 Tax=Rhodotorula paludigena TaxID=86838 RepID=UPI0031822B45
MIARSLLLAAVATAASATKILLPLYEYSEACWPELQEAASQNPSLEFILIFNPNSGPVTDPEDPSLYCVPKLRALLPGSTFIGYVRTGYGKRTPSDGLAEIEEYRSWKDIKVDDSGKTAALDGIFFDEVLDEDSDKNHKLYQGYADAARSAFGEKGQSTIVMNPGLKVDEAFYSMADIVVPYETYFKDYHYPSSLPDSSVLPSSAIMIHDFPTGSAGTAQLPETVSQIVPAAAAIFLTDVSIDKEDVYQRFGDNWLSFTKLVAQYNGNSSDSAGNEPSQSQSVDSNGSASASATSALATGTQARATVISAMADQPVETSSGAGRLRPGHFFRR